MLCPSELVSDGHLSHWDVFRLNSDFSPPWAQWLLAPDPPWAAVLWNSESRNVFCSFSPSPQSPGKYSYPCCSCGQYWVLRFPVYRLGGVALGVWPSAVKVRWRCLSDPMPPSAEISLPAPGRPGACAASSSGPPFPDSCSFPSSWTPSTIWSWCSDLASVWQPVSFLLSGNKDLWPNTGESFTDRMPHFPELETRRRGESGCAHFLLLALRPMRSSSLLRNSTLQWPSAQNTCLI